jgi:hypothetical protein
MSTRNLRNVASIQPGEGGRIYLSVVKEGCKTWKILTSNGESVDYNFDSRADAVNAIKSFWDYQFWDLHWHKKFREDL